MGSSIQWTLKSCSVPLALESVKICLNVWLPQHCVRDHHVLLGQGPQILLFSQSFPPLLGLNPAIPRDLFATWCLHAHHRPISPAFLIVLTEQLVRSPYLLRHC